ncbi:MAG: S8 family peptidase [Betaproteobacteria bacterium]|nr:S8 family peptidase [Betaproteobacteria bacterium]
MKTTPMKSILWKGTASLLVALIGLLIAASPAHAQTAATFPVIVVFDEAVSFSSFRGNYRADARAPLNPEAWNYLDRGVAGAVQTLEARHGFRADHIYSAALRGFAARLTARQIDALESDPLVAYVEADGTMTIVAQTLPWGIDRIDVDISSTLAGDGSGAITNVNAYIIDTGIDTAHADLNVVGHVNFAGGRNKDCNGHGTHVSGTVAAKDNAIDVVGVAPGAPLTGVKVLGCSGSGTTSGVIKGVDWVTAKAAKPAIANMSLGGSASTSLDTAVTKSADSGVFYSIAAGNSGADACTSSPARTGAHDGVMTTAAVDSNSEEASWSNYGTCVDIWAPGVNILSTRLNGGTKTLSGTSMAAPHVGGTGALYLSNSANAALCSSNLSACAAMVENQLKSNAVMTDKLSKDGTTAVTLDYAGGY